MDGLSIHDEKGDAGSYVKIMCPVDSMVISNTHIRQNALNSGCFLQTTEQASIGCVHISGLTATGVNALIDHSGQIGVLCLNDVLCAGTTEPLVTGEGRVASLHANAVHGAEIK